MKTINIGVANLIVSNLLKESYFSPENATIVESKDTASKFLDVIKSSPLLQLEFKVFNNLENKRIDSDVLGVHYIEENLKTLEVYTIEELNEENAKIQMFINENDESLDQNRIKLYRSIGTLIEESLKISNEVNVDGLHESFAHILNHLKTKVEETPEEKDVINEEIVEIAVTRFNEKYSTLEESDITLIKTLNSATAEEKKNLFEEYKTGNLSLLESLNKEKPNDKITKTIEKINEMKFDTEKVEDTIIDLHELKKGLI
jgi:hypothetical protein